MQPSPTLGPRLQRLATALTAARAGGGGAAVASSAWDPATKSAAVTLSNSNLTATIVTSAGGIATSLPSRNSGKRAIKFTLGFTGSAADDQEAVAGIVPEDWDRIGSLAGFAMCGDGFLYLAVGDTDVGLLVASGEWFALLVDETAGKVWVKTASGVTGDPEAGAGEAATFTPGTAYVAALNIYSANNSSPASVTFDPTYSSGTFAAWDS